MEVDADLETILNRIIVMRAINTECALFYMYHELYAYTNY